MTTQDSNGLEQIEADLLFYPLEVTDLNRMPTAVVHPKEATIQRDANFRISLEMRGKATPQQLNVRQDIRAGTVTDTESTEGTSGRSTRKVALRGVSRGGLKASLFSGEYTLRCSAAKVIEEYRPDSDIHSTILYLLGFPEGTPPRGTRRNSSGESILNREGIPELGVAQIIKRPTPRTTMSGATDCLLLKSRHGTALFSRGHSNALSERFKPSYLHFISGKAVTDESERRAYLEAVSFAFGKRFIDVGHTELDEENNFVRRSARSPYTLNIFSEVSSHALPPTELLIGDHFLDEDLVSKLMNLYLDARDSLDLSGVMWNIWTARMMPLGIELVSYAAALDCLINAWFRRPENNRRSTYLEADKFNTATKPLIEVLRGQDTMDKNWNRVVHRISATNNLSHHDKQKAFFEVLGLKAGKVEDEVIASRHKFAHGGNLAESDVKRLIVIARGYEALLNRCILKAIGFNDTYKDYSTLDFPARALADPMGGPNNDGVI